MYCSQPRKRQLMFSLFGDYRKKMEEDRRREKQGDLAKLKSIFTTSWIISRLENSVVVQLFWNQESGNEICFPNLEYVL